MKLHFEAVVDCDNAAFDGSPLATATGIVLNGFRRMSNAVEFPPNAILARALFDENGNHVGQVTVRHEP